MSFAIVPSDHTPGTFYVYDRESVGAIALAAVKRHEDGSVSIQVTTEVEVYRDGVKLSEHPYT